MSILTKCTPACVGNRQSLHVMKRLHDTQEAIAVKTLKTLTAAAIALTALAAPAAALEPLSQEKYVNDRLIAARIADRVRRSCPTINARIFYAYGEARKLKRYAEQKGYSSKQIDEFLDNKQEKKRIYAVAEDYLARNGAKKDDPESFCKIGRAEIKKNTVIGSLLVSK